MTSKSRMIWAFAVTSTALFMASLDNLVVTTALPSIREHLHAGLEGLQWTVNAYTLTFAVLLLTGATLGERFGRRRLFTAGLAVFTAGSAAVPPERRGLVLGAWGAVGGLAVAVGPLVGGAIVEGASWQWIFWVNVPIGVAILPFART